MLLIALSCAEMRFRPHFHGQDPEIIEYVQEFKGLAHENAIEFGKDPSIGFENIDSSEAIGRCFRGLGFREIIFDRKTWKNATFITRKMMAYHELTHCYCERDHDHANGRYSLSREYGSGYLSDSCPVSIMAPRIVSDDCAKNHFDEYIKEMFDRCKPYK